MYYNTMYSTWGGAMMAFAWITYLLVIVVLVLAAMALWKYINKKK